MIIAPAPAKLVDTTLVCDDLKWSRPNQFFYWKYWTGGLQITESRVRYDNGHFVSLPSNFQLNLAQTVK